jgi:hypothetical protein
MNLGPRGKHEDDTVMHAPNETPRVASRDHAAAAHPNQARSATVAPSSSRHSSRHRDRPPPDFRVGRCRALNMAPVCEPLCHFGGRYAHLPPLPGNINTYPGYLDSTLPPSHILRHAPMYSTAYPTNQRTSREYAAKHKLARLQHQTTTRSTTISR